MASAFPSRVEGFTLVNNNVKSEPTPSSTTSLLSSPSSSSAPHGLAASTRTASPLLLNDSSSSSTTTTTTTTQSSLTIAATARGDSIVTNGGSKKRKAPPGSRGVANLTPEQLAKKRANDREAQRAIRERQRQKIEQYEREIQELRSQPPYQELQAVVRQKEAAEAELAEVKAMLRGIMNMIQPIVSPPSAVDQPAPPPPPLSPAQTPLSGASVTAIQAPAAATAAHPGSTPSSAASPPSAGYQQGGRWSSSLSPIVQPMNPPQQQSQPPSGSQADLFNQQRHDLVHGLELGSDKLGLDFLLDSNQKIARMQPNAAQDSPQYRHAPMKHDWTGATITSIIPPRHNPHHQTQYPPPYNNNHAHHSHQHPAPHPFQSHHQPPASLIPPVPFPQNSPPTCPLDSILLDFLSERRQRFADGQLTPAEIVGPRYPSVSSLLNPSISIYSHPLSKVFTDILARFPLLSTMPERVAVLYLMFLLMRWQVSPTQENYDRLPEWFRPLPIQAERPHPAWLDHIPFPGMRERIIREYFSGNHGHGHGGESNSVYESDGDGDGIGDRDGMVGKGENEFPFENFFIPFTGTLSLNWGYDDVDVLLRLPACGGSTQGQEEDEKGGDGEGGGDLMINPVFERHLGRFENWTLGEQFYRAFPSLRGTYTLKRA